MTDTARFVSLFEPIARHLLGEPNRRLSTKKELRFGARGSLSIDLEKGTWFDHEANEGGGVLDLVTRETGLVGAERAQWVGEFEGWEWTAPRGANGKAGECKLGKIVATYPYENECGDLLFQVVRFDPKDFRQRRPDASARDGWSWTVRGVRQVPYRVPELIEAIRSGHVVVIVEGEKDVDNLRAIGVPATCNAGGAGKWKRELNEFFRGADVVIVADNDPQKRHPKTGEPMFHPDGQPILPGQDHAQAVAAALYGVAARVRVLKLWKFWPEMPPNKADISDWLSTGGSADALYALVDSLPDWSLERVAPPTGRHGPNGQGTGQQLGSDQRRKHKTTQANQLVELASAASLFHTAGGTGYADITIDDHTETWRVQSEAFRDWMALQFLRTHDSAPSSNAMQHALRLVEARARFDSPEYAVHVRVAESNGNIYLDLGDPQWRVIEITARGWRLINRSPVHFRRTRGMLALPVPQAVGSIESLRRFLNVATANDFLIAVAWLLAAFRGHGPYPVLVIRGEQGSAKSTLARILRLLLDPNCAPLRALPREERDLFIAASNGHVLAFDNVSTIPGWLSDALCRLSTGGGFAVRKLFTDDDETLFDAEKPTIINGIEDVVSRSDLADRAVFVTMQPIYDDRRVPEQELWAAFEAEQPRILGVLCDAVAHGLRSLPQTRITTLPRMADFACWAAACEGALWQTGTFSAAYTENRTEAISAVIDGDPLVDALRSFIAIRGEWAGRASELLESLSEQVSDLVRKSKAWPNAGNALTGRLRRLATFLRQVGIVIEFDRQGKAGSRMVHLRKSG